jgi:hypothetical protein
MRIALLAVVVLSGCASQGYYYGPPPPPHQPLVLTPISRPAQQQQSPRLEYGPVAVWTGRSEPASTVLGMPGVRCEYTYAGRTFVRTLPGHCQPTVPVE